MRYSKLVRDNIPTIIRKNGERPIIHTANQKEYRQALQKKLQEEVAEFLTSNNIDELADILEVVYACSALLKTSPAKLEQFRRAKAKKRGGFTKRIILEETS